LDKVIIFNRTGTFITDGTNIYNLTIPIAATTWTPAYTESVLGITAPYASYIGTFKYAVEVLDKQTGQKVITYLTTVTVPLSASNKFINVNVGHTDAMNMDRTRFKFILYRKEALSTPVVTDADYYFVTEKELDLDNFTSIRDGVSTGYIHAHDSLLEDQLPLPGVNYIAATWYQDRVVWAHEDGYLSVSALTNPLVLPLDLSQKYLVNEKTKITGLTEYIGTLIVFTRNGIYHIVGTFADRTEDGNDSQYQALQAKKFILTKGTLVVDNFIFVLADDGLYKYDAREIRYLGRNIAKEWETLDLTGVSLTVDEFRKLIFICVPTANRVYVYHYSQEAVEEDGFVAGPWTKWDLTVGTSDRCLQIGGQRVFTSCFAIDDKVIIPKITDTGSTFEDIFEWFWTSQKFDGGDIWSYKKWEELRLQLNQTADVDILIPTGLSTIAYEPPATNAKQTKRLRLKTRNKECQFKISGGDKVVFSGFALEANIIGR
jgi:hypothetical protein